MSQEIVGDVFSLTHGGNGLLQISRVPEDDRGDEEIEARDVVQLVFVGAVTNFTQPVDEDGARQTVAGFALIELLASRAAKFGVVDPIQREQRPLQSPQFTQRRGDAVLPWGMRRADA